MKLQDVLLKAMAKKISWMEAAEIAGVTDRTMRRIRHRYGKFGYTGLFDQRRGKRSIHRIAMETAEEILRLYREVYFDLNMRHFHEKLREEHAIQVSYTWVQQALQGAGLVAKRRKRGPHRRRRPRRPMAGMLLHIDGSKHRWLNDDRWYDLIVILDDATSEIYYAQLVEEESTRTVMAGLREVIESQGLFCALYSDRGSHFFVTVKEGEKVDKHRLTQVGRAMKELGVHMIAAYSPQARGRSERSFGTWQGRLPQELRLAGITTVEGANTCTLGPSSTPTAERSASRLMAWRPRMISTWMNTVGPRQNLKVCGCVTAGNHTVEITALFDKNAASTGPSSAMSSARLFLDQGGRHQSPSPPRRHPQNKSLAYRRASIYHRTAGSVLTVCVSRGDKRS